MLYFRKAFFLRGEIYIDTPKIEVSGFVNIKALKELNNGEPDKNDLRIISQSSKGWLKLLIFRKLFISDIGNIFATEFFHAAKKKNYFDIKTKT